MLDNRQPFGKRAPGDVDGAAQGVLQRRQDIRTLVSIEGCQAHAAVAGDDRGHALHEQVLRQGVFQQGHIRMRVRIDEARTGHLSASIDHPVGCSFQRADRDDFLPADAQAALESGRSRAVHDLRILDQNIIVFAHQSSASCDSVIARSGCLPPMIFRGCDEAIPRLTLEFIDSELSSPINRLA